VPENVSARESEKIFNLELILFAQRKTSASADGSYANKLIAIPKAMKRF
jgi:hypothetical protein